MKSTMRMWLLIHVFCSVLLSNVTGDVPQMLAVNMHTLEPAPGELAMVTAGGFATVRMDLDWNAQEPSHGKYDFEIVDAFVAGLTVHKLRWLAIAGSQNSLYDNGDNVHTPEGIAAYARWCAVFTKRYSDQLVTQRIMLELVNEPNSNHWYKNASIYSDLVNTAAIAIKSAVPQAQVVGPASENIDLNWLTQIFECGVLHSFTQITVHPYRSDEPETAASDLVELRTLVDEYTPLNQPRMLIHSGEWGYSSVPTSSTQLNSISHGKVISRLLLTTIASGVGMCVVYDWRDSSPSPNAEIMGMVENTLYPGRTPPFNPKPAYNATQVLAGQLTGCEFVERLAVYQSGRNTEDDWVLLFKCNNSNSNNNYNNKNNNNNNNNNNNKHKTDSSSSNNNYNNSISNNNSNNNSININNADNNATLNNNNNTLRKTNSTDHADDIDQTSNTANAYNTASTHTNATSIVLVVWTTSSFQHVTRLPGGEGCFSVFDWLGHSQSTLCHDPRGLHINLTDSPQYLRSLS